MIEIIDILKPKNGGDFKLIEAIDVFVDGYESLADAVSHMATTAMITAINTALSGKADVSDLEALQADVADKADAADLTALEAEVDAKADSSDLTTATANLQAQIDNIVSGSTEDSEVINARVAPDGTTYPTLKQRLDAIDTDQGRAISDFVAENTYAMNLHNANDPRIQADYYYNNSGVKTSGTGYYVSEPIFVAAGYTYKATQSAHVGDNSVIVYVDKSGNVLSKFNGTVNGNRITFTPPKSGYISLNLGKSTTATVALESLFASAESYYNLETTHSEVKAARNSYGSLDNRLDTEFGNLSSGISDAIYDDKRICNLYNPNDSRIQSGKYYDGTGVVIYAGYYVSEPILVSEGVDYSVTVPEHITSNAHVAIVDKGGTYKGDILGAITNSVLTFTAPVSGYVSINLGIASEKDSIVFARADIYSAGIPTYYSIETLKKDLSDKNYATYTESDNLTDTNKMADGYLTAAGFVIDANYATSDYIPVEVGSSYTKYCQADQLGNNANLILLYNDAKQLVGNARGESTNTNFYHYTISDECKYIRYTHGKKSDAVPTHVYFAKGSTEPSKPFDPFARNLDSSITILGSQISGDVPGGYKDELYGKKWYVIGDSSSHGDFSGITQPTLPSGLYAGQLPVYPFFIGNRTEMEVHNLAVNGATIATITGGSMYQFSVDGVYDEIVDSDADYITLWLGANDMWNNVPIGTIDSSDATTFYGAWNKLLAYYSENFPNTKLGVVVSFWLTQNYAEAVKAVAKKYGVPYLNLYDDDKVPVTVGSQRPDVSEAVRTLRNNQWVVSETNKHPSAKYHEIESYFIENWLRSL